MFVLGFVSLIHSLTSGQKNRQEDRQTDKRTHSKAWSQNPNLSTHRSPRRERDPEAIQALVESKRGKVSREQRDVLVKSFEEEPLPNFDQCQAMAEHLGMTPRSVQIWFQNRRHRLKKSA